MLSSACSSCLSRAPSPRDRLFIGRAGLLRTQLNYGMVMRLGRAGLNEVWGMSGGGQTFTESQNVCAKPLNSKKGRPLLVSGERGVCFYHQISTKSLSTRQAPCEGLVRPK